MYSTNFILLLLLLLIIIYVCNYTTTTITTTTTTNTNTIDNFKSNFESGSDQIQNYQHVDYNTKIQNCNELTYDPEKCIVKTVIPSNINVCGDTLTPISNNQLENENFKTKKNTKNKNTKNKNNKPPVSLLYDSDLLSSFNDSQIDNLSLNSNQNINLKPSPRDNFGNNSDLETEVRSLNSLENDLMSNY